jgi:pantoate--beta-alanine ligase
MRTLRSVAEVRAALAPARREQRSIGLVPTMGALHEGHLSLLRRAGEECNVVVMSLFVNPTQFNEQADLRAYPRDERRDFARAADVGVDLVFAPSVHEMYPADFSTTVGVGDVSHPLEGAARGSGHFRGVATVVTKLLNVVMPDVAYFGQKDAQQTAVIRRLVRDLDLPVRVVVCPTVREPDGLALSSRNARLTPEERRRAVALWQGLTAAEQCAHEGERDGARLVASARAVLSEWAVDPEYLALVDPDTMAPVRRLEQRALLAVAARLGDTRLIDNTLLQVPAARRFVAPREASTPRPAAPVPPMTLLSD